MAAVMVKGHSRPMMKGTCATCGSKKCCFVKGGSKGGDGLFSFIPGGVGDFLDNVGNAAASVALPIASQVLTRKLGGGVRKR